MSLNKKILQKLILLSLMLIGFILIRCGKSNVELEALNEDSCGSQNFLIVDSMGTGESIILTKEERIVIAGETRNSNYGLIKFDENQNIIWMHSYGGDRNEELEKAIMTDDNGFALIGGSRSFSNGTNNDIYLVKTDEEGKLSWSENYGTEESEKGYDIIQTLDKGYLITADRGLTPSNGLILKLNSSGKVMWSKENDNEFGSTISTIIESSDSTIMTVGILDTETSNILLRLSKIDGNGNTIWEKIIEDLGVNNSLKSLVRPLLLETSSGELIITANTPERGTNIFLAMADKMGTIQWSNYFYGEKIDQVNSIIKTSDDGYLLIGQTNSFGNCEFDILLLKTDFEGKEIWRKTYGGSLIEAGRDAMFIDNRIIITGLNEQSDKIINDHKLFVLSLDSEGNPL